MLVNYIFNFAIPLQTKHTVTPTGVVIERVHLLMEGWFSGKTTRNYTSQNVATTTFPAKYNLDNTLQGNHRYMLNISFSLRLIAPMGAERFAPMPMPPLIQPSGSQPPSQGGCSKSAQGVPFMLRFQQDQIEHAAHTVNEMEHSSQHILFERLTAISSITSL